MLWKRLCKLMKRNLSGFCFLAFFVNLISLDWVASLADIGYSIFTYDANWKLFHVWSHLSVLNICIWIELCFVFFSQEIFLKLKFGNKLIGLLFSFEDFQLLCYLNWHTLKILKFSIDLQKNAWVTSVSQHICCLGDSTQRTGFAKLLLTVGWVSQKS